MKTAITDDTLIKYIEKEKYLDNNKNYQPFDMISEDERNIIIDSFKNIKRGRPSKSDPINKLSPQAMVIRTKLEELRNKLRDKLQEDSTAFKSDFETFLKWWINEEHGGYKKITKQQARDKNGYKKCFYCGITEEKLNYILCNCFDSDDKNPYKKYKYHKSKKGEGWNSPNMEIERLDPNGGYNDKNCVFACSLCNNAKTDIIEASDFIENIAPSFKKYYKTLKR